MLEGAVYSALDRFLYPPDRKPTYLSDVYGLDAGCGPAWNLGEMLREDFRFVDSRKIPGVQVADLLAAGLRRVLRQGFTDNKRASQLLGSIMVQATRGEPPMRFAYPLQN